MNFSLSSLISTTNLKDLVHPVYKSQTIDEAMLECEQKLEKYEHSLSYRERFLEYTIDAMKELKNMIYNIIYWFGHSNLSPRCIYIYKDETVYFTSDDGPHHAYRLDQDIMVDRVKRTCPKLLISFNVYRDLFLDYLPPNDGNDGFDFYHDIASDLIHTFDE